MTEIIYNNNEVKLLPQGIPSPYRPVAIEKHCPCSMCSETAYKRLIGKI